MRTYYVAPRGRIKMKIFFLFLCTLLGSSLADYKRLRCLVCRATIEEMTKQINSVNPKKKIQVGGYRLDDTGKLEEKLVPFARSGMHLSELMDSICEKMENYARAIDKKSKKLVLLNLFTDSSAMNPDISNVDFVQDADLNKSLTFYCEGIVEEFENEIYDELKEPSEDPVNRICTKATNLCEFQEKDEL